MDSAPCWVTREEADPRYAYAEDTFDMNAPMWAPNCGHEACVNDPCPGFHDWDCPQAQCRWDTAHAMCDLDAGHEGEHVFVPPNEIILEFPEPRVPAGAAS